MIWTRAVAVLGDSLVGKEIMKGVRVKERKRKRNFGSLPLWAAHSSM